MEPMTLSEFARRLGVSNTAVRKAIAVGRIPTAALTMRQQSSGRRVPAIADVGSAEAAFRGAPAPTRPAAAPGRLQPADATASIPDIATSKAIVEAFKAKLIQLEFDERSAKLVDATEFRTRFSTMVATARTRLLGVASKAKGRIPHLTINEIEVLTKLIREALEGLPEACERVQALLDGIREQWSPLVDDLPATAATAGERS